MDRVSLGPENNQVKIPNKPGLGFEPDYDMLKDSLVKNPAELLEGGMLTNRDQLIKALETGLSLTDVCC